MNRNYRQLPKIVNNWLYLNKAWIVGSGVDWYLGKDKNRPKDLDILIPYNQWNKACKLIPYNQNIIVNSFGGFKSIFDGIDVDFWPSSLEDYFEIGVFTMGKKEIKALRLNTYTLVIGNN